MIQYSSLNSVNTFFTRRSIFISGEKLLPLNTSCQKIDLIIWCLSCTKVEKFSNEKGGIWGKNKCSPLIKHCIFIFVSICYLTYLFGWVHVKHSSRIDYMEKFLYQLSLSYQKLNRCILINHLNLINNHSFSLQHFLIVCLLEMLIRCDILIQCQISFYFLNWIQCWESIYSKCVYVFFTSSCPRENHTEWLDGTCHFPVHRISLNT